jgi:hypothetical protein
MKKSFVLHDESVNTLGFRMLTSGADLTEFKKNPMMFFMHDESCVIGRWDNIRVENNKIVADAEFDEEDEFAREISRKVQKGFIRMASIGSWPPEGVSDDSSLKVPGQTGFTVTAWKPREASIVTIGANHNALTFYDHRGGRMSEQEIIRLVDSHIINKNKNENDMKVLAGILNLADTASESEVASVVRQVIADRDRLKTENVTLKDRVDAINREEKEKQKAQAVALTDAAIRDGRIEAKARDSYLKLFDSDFDATRQALEAIPARQSVTRRIENSAAQSAIELKDLQDKTWDELDRADKLTLLRDQAPELYAEKFKVRFGCEPK